ncbi:MAG: hypothetical protein ACXVYM_01545, partial [Gaiellaceae bacterium]
MRSLLDLPQHRSGGAPRQRQLAEAPAEPSQSLALRFARLCEGLLPCAREKLRLRLPKAMPGVEQQVDLEPVAAGQLVQEPCCPGRLAQP